MSPGLFSFRLYIAGNAPTSLLAKDNLLRLCETHLPGRYEIDIVDVLVEPKRALEESILMTPTLVTDSPYPGHRIVGTLDQTEPILQILGLGVAQRRDYPGLKDREGAPQLVRRPGEM